MSPDTLLSSTEDISRSSLLQESTSPSKPVPSQQHVQSNLEFYRSQLPQLLDVILARDCLSFCPILREDFIHDFAAGSGQNCSAALIDALLALATLLAREKIVALAAPYPEGELQEDLGNAFAQEAIAALYSEEGLPQNVADIQALGILALYCLGCGKMNDGLGFASDFGAAIAEQWRIRQSDPNFAHRQTYATIYCAAVSFNRLLFLIQDYHKTLDGLAIKVGLERSPLHESGSIDSTISSTNLSGSIIDDAFFEKDLSLLPNSPKVVAAKVFEFTEWVYKARFTVEKSFDQAVKLYQNGLQWYESFFAYTSSCTNETPLVLFAHTYYHFGVMCLLTPYVLESVAVASDGTLPIMVCKQAAGSIGELVQHYSKLYNDGQLLDFMPFFKAAAVAFLEICEAKIPA
ncbi:hypothetical protein V2A60_009361 [Cordyceps javanica]|uniref:Nitrate assimilation regulatory protein nirA n=1 Tax=Cordyceps javanica TaxID=43265 RepID=A0A545VMT0_9HYPO|nr:nitrate assimilation regulatory protein nirA [Cordyceps javanica]TQW03039.1 nitrate assimilation regulatory protein nirA [Cordyceps javanica]